MIATVTVVPFHKLVSQQTMISISRVTFYIHKGRSSNTYISGIQLNPGDFFTDAMNEHQ